MYAIVDIAGQQFKVEKDKKLFVHRLGGNTGSEISFDKVLLIENDGKITIGDPVIKDAAVSAKVVEHVKGDKVLVFKKKRRKGYRKLNGHRQYLTQIEITDITEKAAKKPVAKAAEEKKEAEPKAAVKKPATKKSEGIEKAAATKTAAPKAETDKKAADKKAAPAKKPAAKKPAAKSASEKKPAAAKSTAAKKPAAKKSEGGEKAADKE
jgi:large subunit ribosomal protein L21